MRVRAGGLSEFLDSGVPTLFFESLQFLSQFQQFSFYVFEFFDDHFAPSIAVPHMQGTILAPSLEN